MSMAEVCALAGQHDSEPRAEHRDGRRRNHRAIRGPGLRRLVHGFSESSGAHREESIQGAEAQIIGVAQEADGINPWVNDAVNRQDRRRLMCAAGGGPPRRPSTTGRPASGG